MLSKRSSLLSLVILCALASSAVGQFEVARLVAHDGQPSDQFGASVGIDGDTAIVGAPFADGAATDTGAAYVFRSVNGNWIEEAKLIPTDISAYFGASVAIDGNRIVVGCPGGECVYVFRRSGTFPFTTWSQQAKLLPSDVTTGGFGRAVAISSGTVAVGASASQFSAVYVYVNAGAQWSEQAKVVTSPYPFASDSFGASVSLENDNLLVGAPLGGGQYNGCAYVFVRSSGVWTQDAAFTGPPNSSFGIAVTLAGNTAVIGAPGSYPNGAAFGSSLNGMTWSPPAPIVASQQLPSEHAGASVAIAGQRVVVGGPDYSTTASAMLGIARVFEDNGGTWSPRGAVRPKLPLQNKSFAAALAASGELVVAGCPLGNGVTPTSGSALIVSLSPPAPVAYCSAKVNSQGCLPAITVQGAASATDAQPFLVGAAAVLNNKFGLLFFGTSGPANFPFQGGTLCVLPPIRRTDSTLSGGNAGVDDCSGSYSFNFNALIQSGLYPDLTAGVLVDCQYWSRDPASPSTTGLTNAVEFGIGF